MITYLNNSNAQQYHILFDKAAALLKRIKPNSLTDALREYSDNNTATTDELWNEFSISSLNEYFAYLEDILKAARAEATTNDTFDEDAERFYVRLPLDEDVFAINADTREITIPANFASNGVGVQGDEMCEVVYFTIDRFFDMQDLASDNIHIAIQWELTRNGEQLKGFSRNFGKDIESVPGKIIFGWPISHELTETSGSIRFAIRFYSIDADNSSFNYSLTTLPATVRINSSLDHDVIANALEEINHGQVITKRIKNAGIYNPSMPTPKAPIITIPLHVMDPETEAKIVDIPASGQIKLGICARPSDVGVIGYNWKKYKYIPETGKYDVNAVELTNNINIEPIEVTDKLNPDNQYYTISTEGDDTIYSLLDVKTQLVADSNGEYPYLYENEEEDEETGSPKSVVNSTPSDYPLGYLTVNNSYLPHVYQKMSTAIVDSTGIYTVDISAKALVNTTTTGMKDTNGIKIPGPLSPVVEVPADIATGEGQDRMAHVIVDSTPYSLAPKAVAGELGKDESQVGAEPVVNVERGWQYNNGESWVTVTAIEDKVEIDGENIIIKDLINTETVKGDFYREVATSTRNGVSTTAYSAPYRVTHSPEKPHLNTREYNTTTKKFEWTERDYQTTNLGVKNMGSNALLSLGVTPRNLKTDGLSYIWVKANRSDEEILQGQYPIDLPPYEAQQTLINKINTALGIVDSADDGEGNIIERPKDDIIEELNKMGEVELDESDTVTPRYQTEYQTKENGVYYCVVINELNNNIAVNVSPFFVVS